MSAVWQSMDTAPTDGTPIVALDPAEGWPPLVDSYTEMAATQAAADLAGE